MVILKEFIRLHILAKISLIFSYIASSQLPPTLDSLCYDKPYNLIIPTPDSSGQAVHPDIYKNTTSNPAYVLSFTPYPFSRDKFENPSLLISSDGLHFHEEKKGLNPLVPAPPVDHNDDPDLFIYKNTWNILYLETLRPDTQNLVLLESSDRLEWKSRILYSANLHDQKSIFVLSPSFVSLDSRNYIFFVNKSDDGNTIEFVSSDELNFSFDTTIPVSIDMGMLEPWHIDIIQDKTTFYMLICTVTKDIQNKNHYSLYIARSNDLKSWDLSNKRILSNAYRSTGFVSGPDIFVYYSRQSGFLLPWHIGVYRTAISSYFNDN